MTTMSLAHRRGNCSNHPSAVIHIKNNFIMGKMIKVKGNKQTNIIGGIILRSVIVPPILHYYVIWVQYDDL